MKRINWTTLVVSVALVIGLVVAVRAHMTAEQIAGLASAGIVIAAQLNKLHGEPRAPSDAKRPAPPPLGPPMLLVLLVAFDTGTACTLTPAERRAVDATTEAEKTACSVVNAVGADGTPKTVCAFADELANMASLITARRSDAGPSYGRRASCEPLAGTALCATNAERLAGIEATLRARGGGS